MTSAAALPRDDPRHTWFARGLEILATDGSGGLKLAPLCRSLDMTTGGFYHWFDNWADYTEGLLAAWRRSRTTALAELARTEPDPAARLRLLATSGTELNHATEAAIRAWSRIDPAVGEVQGRVDEERFAVVLEAMEGLVGADDAHRFAVWGYSVLVGFEQLAGRYSREELMWSLLQILDAAERHGSR